MPSLRKVPALLGLYINMSIADGMSGLFLSVRGNCHLLKLLYRGPPLISAVMSVIFDLPFIMKFFLMTIASVERYISICRPMHFPMLGKYFGKLIISAWIMVLIVQSAVSILLVDKVCLGNSGPTLVLGLTNLFAPFMGCLTGALILTTMFLTSLVLLELRRMMRRVCPPSMVERDTEVLNATKYLITYMVTMVISLTPLNAVMYFWYFHEDWREKISRVMLNVIILLMVCHGILDTIFFGWMMPSFRQEIKRLFQRLKCTAVVRDYSES